jgi:TonB family protein
MITEKLFLNTLLISVLAHGIILVQTPNFTFSSKSNKVKSLEIKYVTEAKPNRQLRQYNNIPKGKSELLLDLPEAITAKTYKSAARLPSIDKPALFSGSKERSSNDSLLSKPVLVKSEISVAKKNITFHQVAIEKSNNPGYISYYQVVREKIRRAAYQNYTRSENGEVYLAFVISNDGAINEIHVVDGKSMPGPYLKEIALRSVKDAAPFPPFPTELDYEKLSFNVVVSFEVE